jgi:two-component system, OmpR family, phosphate regulon sensor histidine kinase PhoR
MLYITADLPPCALPHDATGMALMSTKLSYELLQSFPDSALVIDQHRKVIAWNKQALEFFQIDLAHIDVDHILRQSVFISALGKVELTRQSLDVDLDFFGPVNRSARIFISPVPAGSDLLLVLRDFTREQAIEKMRSDFVANASHEMRTPLAAVISAIETLQGAAKHDEAARARFLETMLTQSLRMKRLIDDLLVLSRIELNEHVQPDSRVALNDIVRQAKANLATAADALNIAVQISAAEPVAVSGDADELLQVVQNLLENAIKYGGRGGRVEIECSVRGTHGLVSVRDHGKGIAEEHLPRLTERFYRVNTQESRARGGTGLGLAIVKHILLRHRGRLMIHSIEGQGSTFSFLIPLYRSKS